MKSHQCGFRCAGSAVRAALSQSSLVISGYPVLGGPRWPKATTVSGQPVGWQYHEWAAHDALSLDGRSDGPRSLTASESLAGSSFQIGAGDEARALYLWGRGSFTSFDDRIEARSLDGNVRSATVGAEFSVERMLGGIALSHSLGTGSFLRGYGDGVEEGETSVSGVYPYAHFRVSKWLTVWGTLGQGSGTLKLAMEDGGSIRTGLSLQMGAVGSRAAVRAPTPVDGRALYLEADALVVQVSSDAASRLPAVESRAGRTRVRLEGTWPIVTDAGELTPYAMAGVRRDGGEREDGLGVEAGGGIRHAHPTLDLTSEFDVHGLLAHEVDDLSDWSVSGSVRYNPYSNTSRGPSLQLTSSWGEASARDPGSLWRHESAFGSLPSGIADRGAQIDAEMGYGFPVLSGSGTGTPWVGLSLSDRRRDFRFGYRLGFGPSLAMGIDALVRDGRVDDVRSDAAVMARLAVR